MSPMEPRISLITLGVADLSRAIRFYRDGLGLPLRGGEGGTEAGSDAAASHGEAPIAFFETSSTWLSLYPREKLAVDAQIQDDGVGWGGFTLAHNVRSEAEVQPLIDRAIAAGATLVKRAQRAEWGGWSGYFRDPDGFLWEIAHNPFTWIG